MREILCNVRVVADILGIDYSTTLRYLRDGKLRGYKLPFGWRVPESAIDEYIKKYGKRRVTGDTIND